MEVFCLKHVERKKNCFLKQYKQPGGSQVLPINISRRGYVLTICSINDIIHKNSYDFYNAAETVKNFISDARKN